MRLAGKLLVRLGFASAAILLAAVPAQASSHHARHCTIRGTRHADVLSGSWRRDVICGEGGADTIYAKGGNDVVYGGGGADVEIGGGGDDILRGEPADDSLRGGAGDDKLEGGPGKDDLAGGAGDNVCAGGDGTDDLADSCDDQPPKLVAFDFSPQTIDTSGGPQTISVTAEITDDLSGVANGPNGPVGSLEFVGPRDGPHVSALFTEDDLVSGNELDGTYQTDMTVPQNSPTGRWDANISLIDRADNFVRIGPEDLTPKGFPGWFTQDGPGDSAAPKVQSISVSPASVDTSAGPQSLTFTAHITDNRTGLDSASTTFKSPSGQSITATFGSSNRTSGTATDGVYQDTETLWQYAESGTWTLDSTRTSDLVGNHKETYHDRLAQDGVTGQFSQSGAGDGQPPVLKSLTVQPDSIDTSSGPATITVTGHITDNLSGLVYGDLTLASESDPLQYVDFGMEPPYNLISGSATDGVYQNVVQVPQGSECGTWSASFLRLDDLAHNEANLYQQDLADAGTPGTFTNC